MKNCFIAASAADTLSRSFRSIVARTASRTKHRLPHGASYGRHLYGRHRGQTLLIDLSNFARGRDGARAGVFVRRIAARPVQLLTRFRTVPRHLAQRTLLCSLCATLRATHELVQLFSDTGGETFLFLRPFLQYGAQHILGNLQVFRDAATAVQKAQCEMMKICVAATWGAVAVVTKVAKKSPFSP